MLGGRSGTCFQVVTEASHFPPLWERVFRDPWQYDYDDCLSLETRKPEEGWELAKSFEAATSLLGVQPN